MQFAVVCFRANHHELNLSHVLDFFLFVALYVSNVFCHNIQSTTGKLSIYQGSWITCS